MISQLVRLSSVQIRVHFLMQNKLFLFHIPFNFILYFYMLLNTFFSYTFLFISLLQNEGPKHVSSLDSHQFPENEEANVLGHGSPVADLQKSTTSVTAAATTITTQQHKCCSLLKSSGAADNDDNKYMKNKLLLNFDDVSTVKFRQTTIFFSQRWGIF